MKVLIDGIEYIPTLAPFIINRKYLTDKVKTGPEEYNWSEEEIAQFKAALAEMFGWKYDGTHTVEKDYDLENY